MTILRLFLMLLTILASASVRSEQDAQLETRQWLLVADTSANYPVWTIIEIDQEADLSSLFSFSRKMDGYSILLHEIWEAMDLRIEGGVQMSIPVAMRFSAPPSSQISAQTMIPFGVEEMPQLFSALQECLREGPEVRFSFTLGAWSLLKHGGNTYIPMEEWGEPRALDLPKYGGYYGWPVALTLTEGGTNESDEFLLHLALTIADRHDIQAELGRDAKLELLLEAILRKEGHQNPQVRRTGFGGVLIHSSPPDREENIDPNDPFRWRPGFGEGHEYDLGAVLSAIYHIQASMERAEESDKEDTATP